MYRFGRGDMRHEDSLGSIVGGDLVRGTVEIGGVPSSLFINEACLIGNC